MRSSARLRLAATLVALLAVLATGCSGRSESPAKSEPRVSPPAIGEAGVLRVGVDPTYPPFAGIDKGKQAGIDVDVARALGSSLGLEITLVSVVPSEAASALDSRTVDVVFSVPFTQSALAGSSLAGSYIVNGPAFFTTADATVTVDSIGERAVGVQTGSEAAWLLEEALGEGAAQQFGTLREALQALATGEVQVVAGDASVGAYIARDLSTVRYAGQFGPAKALGVAVAKDNVTLGDSVRTALDDLAASGALANVRRTWLGDLPEIKVLPE
jgi:polar amino acid transport system substrate-binding protein